MTLRRHKQALYDAVGPEPHCINCNRKLQFAPGVGGNRALVHYIDGDRNNLDPCNLRAICTSCIRRLTHPHGLQPGETVFVNNRGRQARGTQKNCEACGRVFIVETANAKNNPQVGRYCSGSCRSRTENLKRAAARRGAMTAS